jgi:site-specific DNA recombinase
MGKSKTISKVVAYCRVSTDNQADEGTIELQVTAIADYCKKQGFELARVFKDEGFSGSLENRPALSEMFDFIDQNKIHAVVIWKLDRVARDLYIQEMILKKLADAEVKILSLKETDLDSNDPMRVAFRQFIGIMSQLERAYITMRLREGRKNKARKGMYAGGRIAFGYRLKSGELAIDKEQAEVVKQIYTFRKNHHYSFRQIAKELNRLSYPTHAGGIWGASSVQSILKNQKYRGTINYAGETATRKDLVVVQN